MKIHECEHKSQWIQPVTGSFLQSWDWGELKGGVTRKQVKDGHTAIGQSQGFLSSLPFGIKYLYIPKYKPSQQESLMVIADDAKKQGCAFIRLEPASPTDNSYIKYTTRGAKNRQPKQTLILDINKEEEGLLSAMHQKTRYNINLAKRKGVVIKKEKDVEVFWKLNEQTTSRDNFRSHEKEYYKKMLEADFIHQFTAFVDDTPVAVIICIGYGNTFTYLHGASGDEHRNVMAPYLLQWEAIKYAKNNGFQHYDFWGVAPLAENGSQCFNGRCWNKKHAWSGVTRFKVGFGGRYESYPQAFDIVLNPFKYYFYKIGFHLKRLI